MKLFLQIVASVLVSLGVHWLLYDLSDVVDDTCALFDSRVTDLSDVVLRNSTEAVPTAHAEAKKPLAVDWQKLRELDYPVQGKNPQLSHNWSVMV